MGYRKVLGKSSEVVEGGGDFWSSGKKNNVILDLQNRVYCHFLGNWRPPVPPASLSCCPLPPFPWFHPTSDTFPPGARATLRSITSTNPRMIQQAPLRDIYYLNNNSIFSFFFFTSPRLTNRGKAPNLGTFGLPEQSCSSQMRLHTQNCTNATGCAGCCSNGSHKKNS